jgi:hypothetical protein
MGVRQRARLVARQVLVVRVPSNRRVVVTRMPTTVRRIENVPE